MSSTTSSATVCTRACAWPSGATGRYVPRVHLLRYQANPDVGMLVLLGEVGGREEYLVGEAIKKGVFTKLLVAWCIGTCADMFAWGRRGDRHGQACCSGQLGGRGAGIL